MADAVLETLSDPALLAQVLSLIGEVRELSNTYVVDCPGGHARVYVVRTNTASS